MFKHRLIVPLFLFFFATGYSASTIQPDAPTDETAMLRKRIIDLEQENSELMAQVESLLSQLNSLETSKIEQTVRERESYEKTVQNAIEEHKKQSDKLFPHKDKASLPDIQ